MILPYPDNFAVFPVLVHDGHTASDAKPQTLLNISRSFPFFLHQMLQSFFFFSSDPVFCLMPASSAYMP